MAFVCCFNEIFQDFGEGCRARRRMTF